MNCLIRRRWLAALAVLLALTVSARAEEINWTYESSGPAQVYADGGSTGAIVFNYSPQDIVNGNSHVVVANLYSWSEAAAAKPDTYTSAPYTMSVYLKDNASGADSTLSFSGTLSGISSQHSALIDNTFTGPMQQVAALGKNLFTVSLLGYVPPGPTGSTNAGAISALVQVTPQAPPEAAPEPTSLALGGLGLALAGLAGWRKRRQIALVS